MTLNPKDSWLYGTHFNALRRDVETLSVGSDKFFKAIEERQELHKKVQADKRLIVRFNRFCERLKRAHNENDIYRMFVWG